MNKKLTLPLLALALAALLGGAAFLYNNLKTTVDTNQLSAAESGAQPPAAQEETPPAQENASEDPVLAPDFTVYDAEGQPYHLSDFFGRPIVLNFWASWCGPCQMEMPDFDEKHKEMGDAIQFLMVNVTSGRETLDTATAFIAESGYTFPVFYDTTTQATALYGAYSLPTTYFIDAEGNLIARAVGAIDGETLLRGIDMIDG